MRKSDRIATLVILAFIVGYLAVVSVQSNQCSDKGGKYVRSAVWFECVEPVHSPR
jgi:hypothetical protein